VGTLVPIYSLSSLSPSLFSSSLGEMLYLCNNSPISSPLTSTQISFSLSNPKKRSRFKETSSLANIHSLLWSVQLQYILGRYCIYTASPHSAQKPSFPCLSLVRLSQSFAPFDLITSSPLHFTLPDIATIDPLPLAFPHHWHMCTFTVR
jgi:hypothetical protein